MKHHIGRKTVEFPIPEFRNLYKMALLRSGRQLIGFRAKFEEYKRERRDGESLIGTLIRTAQDRREAEHLAHRFVSLRRQFRSLSYEELLRRSLRLDLMDVETSHSEFTEIEADIFMIHETTTQGIQTLIRL
jgi:hypothetical protein